MRPLNLIFIVITLAVLGIGGWYGYTKFFAYKQVAGVSTREEVKPARGIIVPHHGLAGELITSAYERVSDLNPKYVVVMGPNHWQPDKYHLVSAMEIEEYSFAEEKIQSLQEKLPFLTLDQELIKDEHSITIQLPYIDHYFPEAEVIPLVWSPVFDKQEMSNLVNELVRQMPEETLFVLSMDFAHEQMAEEGLANNQETIAAINSFDYEKILGFRDEHIDAPVALAAWLRIMGSLGAKEWETWASSHGSLLTGQPTLQGTSYVTGELR